MRLEGLTAAPCPEGNRIVVTWAGSGAPGMRVVRRRTAYPDTPQPEVAAEGVVIADSDPEVGAPAGIRELPDGRFQVVDDGLAAETVHYYRLYPYKGSPARYDEDDDNRISAMATGPYGFADLLYRLLPALYHRYDTVLPDQVLPAAVVEAMEEADRERGQLRRFLELPGGQLDQLYSCVRSLLDLHDLTRVDGRLLPLLGHWIGWRTDESVGLDRRRAEIRNAPALYQTVQTVAAVEATVSRVTGWASRSKEFVDNVFVSNRPERLTLWSARRIEAGWASEDRPLSLDEAHGGRPVAVTDAAGRTRLFYAARKGGRHEIWQKAHIPGEGWSGSEPVVSRPGVNKDPAAAVQGDTVWVFWSVYDQDSGRWRIDFRTGAGRDWSPVTTFRDGPADPSERKAPAALVDGDGALWLFWLERSPGSRWGLRYGRFARTPWDPAPAGSVAFPDDGGADPRVESDVLVLFRPPQEGDPGEGFRRVWVLWARQEPIAGDPEQTRWRIACRVKDGTDLADLGDWGPVFSLVPADERDHDREPAAFVGADGGLEVLWSSTRDGSWSVWQASVDVAANAFGPAAPVTRPPFSERAPLPFRMGDDLMLVYRSNRSLTYDSPAYRAIQTTDRRYSGSTTVRTGNAAAIALHGDYEDFIAYVRDAGSAAGRTDKNRYARDTIGLYLQPDTADPADIDTGKERIRRVLPEFLPATVRAVLL
ncbi:hypothetical protein [Thermomonospora amylolytica]|uniref:hypothetical protein n=1 Tax=Thermomonospora amylolytica TaxID=1411117 RepID=UPI000E6C6763|nr:hypothetical protein [Thermomonospora amylolytica]